WEIWTNGAFGACHNGGLSYFYEFQEMVYIHSWGSRRIASSISTFNQDSFSCGTLVHLLQLLRGCSQISSTSILADVV
ncbi:hypothetical protein COCCADRAFT_106549, partial [Bipolaris zeicola 26-R-13]